MFTILICFILGTLCMVLRSTAQNMNDDIATENFTQCSIAALVGFVFTLIGLTLISWILIGFIVFNVLRTIKRII